MNDSPGSILSSARHFLSGTMLSRIAGLGRDMSMAAVFGAEPAIAALMVAFRLSNLLRRLLGEGALQSAFIPHFEEVKMKSSMAAVQFFRDLSRTLTVLLLILVLVGEGAIGGVLQWKGLSDDATLLLVLTAVMFPSIFFICHYGLNLSLHQCEKRYFTSAVAPLFFNITWIAVIWCVKGLAIDHAVLFLALAIVVAYGIQWGVTCPFVGKFLSTGKNKCGRLMSSEVKRLALPLSMGMLGVGAAQINSALDCFFARYASLEGPAYLWYAIRMQQLPLAIFGIAITNALLPPLARAFKAGEKSQYQNLLSFALQRTLRLLVPCTCAIFALGAASVALLYGRGSFDRSSMEQTTLCLWAYGIGLVPMALTSLLASAYYSQSKFSFPAKVSFISLFVNVLLNFFFVFVMGWGAASVALSTSFSACVNAILLYGNLKIEKGYSVFPFTMKVLLCSACAAVITVYVSGGLAKVGVLGFGNQMWTFCYQGACFFASLLVLSYGFKLDLHKIL